VYLLQQPFDPATLRGWVAWSLLVILPNRVFLGQIGWAWR